MKLILTWLISSLAVIVSAYLVPGAQITGFLAALLAAIMLGAVNSFIRPILLFLTLPINILTLGLFTLVINALMVLLAAAIVPGFSIASFWVALLFSVILSIITWLMEQVIEKDEK